ncbi:MAG: selenocysteine-specific translation elongation factor, partial [Alphaproteobacteria bacterium]
TAGHIDPGKTTLVRALTGVDADRLPEEKRRGMTIDLGFAYMDGGAAGRIGFVDVPGHERFVRTMLAGVAGVDLALLVVAADDGVMPQTREHLAILNLLEAPAGAVALTKADAVASERIAEVTAEIQALTAEGALAAAPIFPLSGVTGEGVDALSQHLLRAARAAARPPAAGRFRLAIDRIFQLHGVGLVVTGTAYAGAVKAGDRVTVGPSGLAARVRGLHAQNRESHSGRDGERLAINLAGVDAERLSRGDWLVAVDGGKPTTRLDVRVTAAAAALDGPGLKDGQTVHVHHGAADVPGRILLLGDRKLAPGEQDYGRITLERPVSAAAWERFVLRDQQGQATLAGGRILDPDPPHRRWRQPDRFRALDTGDAATALAGLLATAPAIAWQDFARARNLGDGERAALLRAVDHVQLGEGEAALLAAPARVAALEVEIADALAAYHARHPEEPGAAPVALRHLMPERPPVPFFDAVVDRMAEARRLTRAAGRLAAPGHVVRFSDMEERLWRRIEPLLE